MKTEKQIQKELDRLNEAQARTQKEFDEYDNYEDLEKLRDYKARVAMLTWVLTN